jgi:hypothetical protein
VSYRALQRCPCPISAIQHYAALRQRCVVLSSLLGFRV